MPKVTKKDEVKTKTMKLYNKDKNCIEEYEVDITDRTSYNSLIKAISKKYKINQYWVLLFLWERGPREHGEHDGTWKKCKTIERKVIKEGEKEPKIMKIPDREDHSSLGEMGVIIKLIPKYWEMNRKKVKRLWYPPTNYNGDYEWNK